MTYRALFPKLAEIEDELKAHSKPWVIDGTMLIEILIMTMKDRLADSLHASVDGGREQEVANQAAAAAAIQDLILDIFCGGFDYEEPENAIQPI